MTKSFEGIRLRASRLRRDIGGIVLACPIFQPRSGSETSGSERRGGRGEHDRLGRARARRGLGYFGGEVSGCHSTPSVFDIWAMRDDGPPFGLQPRSGVRQSMRLRCECLKARSYPLNSVNYVFKGLPCLIFGSGWRLTLPKFFAWLGAGGIGRRCQRGGRGRRSRFRFRGRL